MPHDVQRFWDGLWSLIIIEQTLMRPIRCTGGLSEGGRFDENVRNIWFMSISATIFESMIKLD